MSAQVSLELHHRISQFLFHEASLLDDWKFRDWLAQLDEEIRYTMRTTVNAQTRTAAKASSHRQPGFLMTPKTSWSGESPVWKRAWHGQKSRRHAPAT
ncbi:3-phenylpropionate dioxygenase small subunit [Escherichia coli]|nr:3-phenylpropionate dioxygenase small subunit [Escherichia coli]